VQSKEGHSPDILVRHISAIKKKGHSPDIFIRRISAIKKGALALTSSLDASVQSKKGL